MDKLQHFLDVTFGVVVAQREPQEPNAFTRERQRAFEENARKIEALRQARLAQTRTQQ